jgi:hypothetical protein
MWDAAGSPTGRWAATGGTLALRSLHEDGIAWTIEQAERCAIDSDTLKLLEPCDLVDIDVDVDRSSADTEGRSMIEQFPEDTVHSGPTRYGIEAAPLCGPVDWCAAS